MVRASQKKSLVPLLWNCSWYIIYQSVIWAILGLQEKPLRYPKTTELGTKWFSKELANQYWKSGSLKNFMKNEDKIWCVDSKKSRLFPCFEITADI